jgi:WD40 repeat protein
MNLVCRCHREDQDIYAVNHLSFHPTHHTFVTCGSDGTFNFWSVTSLATLPVRALRKQLRCRIRPALAKLRPARARASILRFRRRTH